MLPKLPIFENKITGTLRPETYPMNVGLEATAVPARQ